MLYYIYRVWTKRRAPNATANITELTPVYDDVNVSRSATITVNQSRVNQSGVNQSRVNQSGVNHSLMLRDGGARMRGPPPPKPQPYSGKPVSVLQQTRDDPFSNILGKTTEPAPVYDDVDVSRSATITVNQSGVNQSGVDQSRVNQSGVNHSLILRDGGTRTRGPPPPKPQPYSGKPVSMLQQTRDDPFSNLLGETTESASVYEQMDDLHPGEFMMIENEAYGQCSHSPRHTNTTTM